MLRMLRYFIVLLTIYILTLLGLGFSTTQSHAASDQMDVFELLSTGNIDAIKERAPEVFPILATLYESSDENTRTQLARLFYMIGEKSPEAKNALMKDIHTKNTRLRLEVQWALGRVSNDEEVVDALLNNMQNDPNPLFRDKSACALASDQIHLNDTQKVRLYVGLIEALNDPKPQVRDIAIKALEIQTGQTKGFKPNAASEERAQKIEEWQAWLVEYKSNI